jgi:hypothetical protein
MMDEGRSLIFVYNADSGLLNALNDGIIKILSPTTYDCKLCGLTFGVISMKPRWRSFIESLDMSVEFLHRDEFNDRYELQDAKFPSVLIKEGVDMRELISREEFEAINSLDELMDKLQSKLGTT